MLRHEMSRSNWEASVTTTRSMSRGKWPGSPWYGISQLADTNFDRPGPGETTTMLLARSNSTSRPAVAVDVFAVSASSVMVCASRTPQNSSPRTRNWTADRNIGARPGGEVRMASPTTDATCVASEENDSRVARVLRDRPGDPLDWRIGPAHSVESATRSEAPQAENAGSISVISSTKYQLRGSLVTSCADCRPTSVPR